LSHGDTSLWLPLRARPSGRVRSSDHVTKWSHKARALSSAAIIAPRSPIRGLYVRVPSLVS